MKDDTFTLTASLRIRNGGMLALRKKYGLSQKKLAYMLDVNVSHISSIENLQFGSLTTRKTAERIAEMFEIPLDSILPPSTYEDIKNTREHQMAVASHSLATMMKAKPELQAPEIVVRPKEVKAAVGSVLETLTYREREVLKRRYWKNETLEQCGNEFKLTRDRIRQIEAKAIRKLQHPLRQRKLKDFMPVREAEEYLIEDERMRKAGIPVSERRRWKKKSF